MAGQEVGNTKKKRAGYEVVIILLVVIAVAVVALGIQRAQSKARNGELLMSELEQIRSAITTYKTLNKSNPPGLSTLTKMTYSFGQDDTPRGYLSNIDAAKDGGLQDPFGNEYQYDAKTGWVVSSTKGFENW